MSHNTKTLHKHFENCQKEIERTNSENNKQEVQTKNVDTGKYLWCLTDPILGTSEIIAPTGDNKDETPSEFSKTFRGLINIIIKSL